MGPIDNLSKAMELMRLRLASRSTSTASNRASGDQASGINSRQGLTAETAVEARVISRLSELELASDSFPRKASRIFLDEVLKEQFGESLWASSEFQGMVDDIQEEWLADPDLVRALHDFARQNIR